MHLGIEELEKSEVSNCVSVIGEKGNASVVVWRRGGREGGSRRAK